MKGLKNLSLYHVLKKRYEARSRLFGLTSSVDFLSHICKYREMDVPIMIATSAIAVWTAVILGKGFFWFLIVDSILFGVTTLTLAIIDTYNTYRYKLRQSMMRIINTLLDVKK